MRNILTFVFYSLFSAILFSQSIATEQWTYIELDNDREMMNPPGGPDWLRSFGIDAADINRDGYKDIVCGKYFYLNPGEDMTDKWKRSEFRFAYDGYHFMDVDGDHLADIIAEDLPNVIWLEADDLNGSSWSARVIGKIPPTGHKNGQGSGIADIIPGAKKEILLAAEGGIFCAAIPDNPSTTQWDFKKIAESHSDEGIGIGDIDGDGDLDLAFGDSKEAGEKAELLYWAENPGNIDQLWAKHLVSNEVEVVDRVEITMETARWSWYSGTNRMENFSWPRSPIDLQIILENGNALPYTHMVWIVKWSRPVRQVIPDGKGPMSRKDYLPVILTETG